MADIGLSNVNGAATAGSPASGISQRVTSFRTIPVVNSRKPVYTLSIRSPNSPYLPILTYTFPISPANLSKTFTAMTAIYDVAAPPVQAGTQNGMQQSALSLSGVQRFADVYGNSPLSIVIQGTTGWQRHSSDNYASTGIESIAALNSVIQQFAQLNQAQSQAGNPNLYTLEFYDYFEDDYWQVVPIGQQVLNQTNARPLIVEYQFRFAGIKAVSEPQVDPNPDPILQSFTTPPNQGLQNISTQTNTILSDYADSTALGLALTA